MGNLHTFQGFFKSALTKAPAFSLDSRWERA